MKNIIRQSVSRLPFRRKWLAAVAGLVGVAFLALTIPAQKAQADNSNKWNGFTLAGSWVTKVGVAPGPTFTALETFTEGGGSVETNNGPGSGPLAPAIGTWVRTGHGAFLATFWRQRFDSNGNFEGNLRVRRAIALEKSGDEFTGRDNVDLFDPAGNRIPVEIPSAPFHGTRIVAEPLTW